MGEGRFKATNVPRRRAADRAGRRPGLHPGRAAPRRARRLRRHRPRVGDREAGAVRVVRGPRRGAQGARRAAAATWSDLSVTLDVAFPEGEGGDQAREVVPRTLKQIEDRLCTVGRTVTLGEPVSYVEGTSCRDRARPRTAPTEASVGSLRPDGQVRPWRDVPRQDGRRFVVTGASSGIGLETAKALAAAGAEVVLARAQPRQGQGRGRARCRATWRSRCSTSPTCRRSGPSPTDVGPVDVLVNNAGVLGAAVRPVAGRGRAAPGDQPPRPLRPDQPAAARGSPTGSWSWAPPRTGPASSTWTTCCGSGAATARSRRTAPRSWRTCCSSPSCSAASPRPGRRCGSTGAHPGTTSTAHHVRHPAAGPRSWSGKYGHRLVGMPAWQGALPTLYAATMDVPGNTYLGPAPAARDDRLADPGRAQRQGARPRPRQGAVGRVRAAERGHVPAVAG